MSLIPSFAVSRRTIRDSPDPQKTLYAMMNHYRQALHKELATLPKGSTVDVGYATGAFSPESQYLLKITDYWMACRSDSRLRHGLEYGLLMILCVPEVYAIVKARLDQLHQPLQ